MNRMRVTKSLLMKNILILYGRVSTEKDEQISPLENQIDICRNWIEKNHFEWNEQAIVLDEGITGTLLLD
ncbi:Resolvase, N terminal domain [Evansella caseinilytica]|uniref:Resolvase, N terminal domain n=1 Tax=Evansella caseinilytica TaxID=1503961 RepID=A0A1H3V229_9BACI|nr:Resolvase, N terminal domain [Evansella caseinilytica]